MTSQRITASDLRRWLGWLALVVFFAVACGFLSNWQFDRRMEKVSAIEQLNANYDAAPLALSAVESSAGISPQYQWHPVMLEGHYLPLNYVLVRNRPLDGAAGFLELVPFQLTDGSLVAIERGWLAADANYNPPKDVPLPSAATQVIVGRIRFEEPSMGSGAPTHQITSINLYNFSRASGIKDRLHQGFYLRMKSESVAVPSTPTAIGKPVLDEGNHLSYALQWILFAVMAVFALGWAIRKELQARSGVKPKRKAKDVDSAFEDQALGQ